MRRRASYLGSVSLCIVLGFGATAAYSFEERAPASPGGSLPVGFVVPPLSEVESKAAFAPVLPHGVKAEPHGGPEATATLGKPATHLVEPARPSPSVYASTLYFNAPELAAAISRMGLADLEARRTEPASSDLSVEARLAPATANDAMEGVAPSSAEERAPAAASKTAALAPAPSVEAVVPPGRPQEAASEPVETAAPASPEPVEQSIAAPEPVEPSITARLARGAAGADEQAPPEAAPAAESGPAPAMTASATARPADMAAEPPARAAAPAIVAEPVEPVPAPVIAKPVEPVPAPVIAKPVELVPPPVAASPVELSAPVTPPTVLAKPAEPLPPPVAAKPAEPAMPALSASRSAPALPETQNAAVEVGRPVDQGEPAAAPPTATPEPTTTSEPAKAEPATSEPAVAEPAVAEPAASEPAQNAVAEPLAPPTVASELAARFAAGSSDKGLQEIAAFYALRGDQPVWIDGGKLTSYAKAGLDRLSRADEDGLDPRAFQVPSLDGLSGADPARIADAELAISTAFVTYAVQAANGRVDARAISRSIVPTANVVDRTLALASIAIAAEPARVLDDFNPPHAQFLALRAKLAELRAADAATAENPPPRVPPGPTLKIGMADARVAVLRTRLGLTMVDGDDVFDDTLAEAVRAFQKQRRMKATGTVGPQTIAALNGGLESHSYRLEDEIIANMERWRWLPRDLGSSNVLVNIPEYRLRMTADGLVVHDSKVIVGKPGTQTPVFSDTMEFVVLNPSWHVPQSIIRNEYLPKLMEDPDYLARRGFVVTYRNGQMSVRQPPGDQNALGHIKFMFPNNFSVYLHDTSSRNLFSSEKRAFSHGCVRVDAPYKFAELVMGAENGWTEEKVRDSVGGKERRVDLKRKLPVHIAYFTAYIDDNGELKLFDDIYGYDQRVLAALGLSG